MIALNMVIDILREHADELRAAGVLHASVFGSMARGEEGPDSDVDVLVTLDPNRPMGLFRYVGIGRRLKEITGLSVDLADRDSLKPFVRGNALREEVRAF